MALVAKFHDPNEVLIHFNGIKVDGYADGEYCTIEQKSESFQEVVGTDGEVVRSKSNDRRLKVVVKLLQTSAANKLFAAAHRADLNAPNGASVGTMSIQNTVTGTYYAHGDQAWINKYPDASLDRTGKSREWEFTVAVGDRDEGGE